MHTIEQRESNWAVMRDGELVYSFAPRLINPFGGIWRRDARTAAADYANWSNRQETENGAEGLNLAQNAG